ncbi:MAG: hypothetical protein ACI4KG_01595 [Oscillospiraceae bacterium]
MKKIFKAALASVIVFMTAAVMSLCVSAETEDVELSVVKAKATNGSWGQSITYDRNSFNCGRFTPDTKVIVEFELDGEWTNPNMAPVELVLQNYSTAKPEIWAKIAPVEYDETTATFVYEDMIASYGSDDLSTVDNMCLGDCGIVMTVTKFTVTACEKPEETTTIAETTVAETTAATTAAETTAAETETTPVSAEKESSGSIPIVLIVVITVVVAVAIVVTIIIIKNKRRFY